MPSPVPNAIKPGEVRNPKGNNQYTYRRDFERWFAEECAACGREGIRRLFEQFKDGESRAQQFVMERAHPAVTKHEVDLVGADPAALDDRLSIHAARSKANGADRSDADSREAGPG